RPRELVNEPRIALLDDLEAVIGVRPGPCRTPSRPESRTMPSCPLLLDPAVLPELDLPVVTGDGALLDGSPDVHLDPVLARVVRATHYAEQRHHGRLRRLLCRRLTRASPRALADPESEGHSAVFDPWQATRAREYATACADQSAPSAFNAATASALRPSQSLSTGSVCSPSTGDALTRVGRPSTRTGQPRILHRPST